MRILILLLTLWVGTGCATNTGTGALSGLVLGVGSGSLVGGGIGKPAGLIGDSFIGAILDEQDRQVMERSSPRTVDRMDRSEPLTMTDVIKLSQGGVADDVIIRYMLESKSFYTLSQAQIRRLKDGGVSQRVIHFMMDSGR